MIRRAAKAIASSETPRLDRPKRYPDGHYRIVARTYLDLLGEGRTPGILDLVAQRETKRLKRTITRETARDWVQRAADLGYLVGRKPGAAGGEAGPRLIDEESATKEEDDG